MAKIEWSDIMWTNHGVFLTAQKVRAAVKGTIKSFPGECIRFDLSVYKEGLKRPEMIYTGLHYQYRGSDDKNHFDRILNREHELNPKAKFRVNAYKAIGI